MLRSLGSVLLLAAGCSTPAAQQPAPPPRDTPDFTCRDQGLDRFLGQLANVDVAGEIQRAAGARILRWTDPRLPAVERRPDRVTVYLDHTLHTVVRISCG